MIGLVLLYFVGKAFYDLAGINNKGQWLFAILGIVSYYAGLFIGGIMLGVAYELFYGSLDEVNDTLLSVLALPFGVFACWGFYKMLKNRWERKESHSTNSEDVLDANLIEKN